MPIIPPRQALVARVRLARREAFGDDGIPQVAAALGIPSRTWENYESGVAMPDTVMLGFVCLTGVCPRWLLTGEGPPYSSQPGPDDRAD